MSIKKEKIYLYPVTSRGTTDSKNPYLYKLAGALSPEYEIVNINDPSGSGILQMFRYFFRTDIAMFNWIENLPERKGGNLQIRLLHVLLKLYRLSGKMIVWTMHNKVSHSREKYEQKEKIFRLMLKYSDLILTHSSAGVEYGKKLSRDDAEKICYIPHPVNGTSEISPRARSFDYDFIIWGSMVPYKGVHNFLKFLSDKGLSEHYSILIIGKFSTPAYLREVQELAGKNTTIENRFASMEELQSLISRSRYVLFTYSDNSVLSSGALMDTLIMDADIIGPDTGAFSDLAAEGIIDVYRDFSDIPSIVEKNKQQSLNREARVSFVKENTWEEAGKKIHKLLLTCI